MTEKQLARAMAITLILGFIAFMVFFVAIAMI